jgi:UDPglucose--hexose-1-phosphate uridylyltransferase
VSDFRQDPITGRWAIVAEDRAARPNEYPVRPLDSPAERCPFCEGHESWTPAEVAVDRAAGSTPNGPGWSVRTIPNKFPTLSPDAPLSPGGAGEPGEDRRPGFGHHEVIVASPRHGSTLSGLDRPHARKVVEMLRSRVAAWGRTPGIAATVAFENFGPESGGTLFHPHLQVVALPQVPPRIEEEARGLARFSQSHGGACGYEWVEAQERARRVRVVRVTSAFSFLAPFASEHPYELRVFPHRHTASLGEASDEEVAELAEWLPKLLAALAGLAPGASYNLVTRSLAIDRPERPEYHWHLDLLPRLVRADGFEVGGGIPVNPVAPEAAAERFRAALEPHASAGPPAVSRPKN